MQLPLVSQKILKLLTAQGVFHVQENFPKDHIYTCNKTTLTLGLESTFRKNITSVKRPVLLVPKGFRVHIWRGVDGGGVEIISN